MMYLSCEPSLYAGCYLEGLKKPERVCDPYVAARGDIAERFGMYYKTNHCFRMRAEKRGALAMEQERETTDVALVECFHDNGSGQRCCGPRRNWPS